MPKSNHNGQTERIRELLEKSPVPLKQSYIASRLGISQSRCTSTLNNMISRLGGACHAGRDGRFRLYGVPGRDDVKTGSQRPNVAGPKYLPPPGTLQRDPFEHMKRALAGPR